MIIDAWTLFVNYIELPERHFQNEGSDVCWNHGFRHVIRFFHLKLSDYVFALLALFTWYRAVRDDFPYILSYLVPHTFTAILPAFDQLLTLLEIMGLTNMIAIS